MKSTISNPQAWLRVLEIEIPSDDFSSAINNRIEDYRKRLNLPGFRKGKVPAGIVKSRFSDEIKSEVVESLVRQSFIDACKAHQIEPIAEAKIKELIAEEGGPLKVSIETEIDAPVEIKGYQSLGVKPKPRKIKGSDVEAAIDGLRNDMAQLVDVSRPSKKGDFLSVEYLSCSINGTDRPDIKGPSHPIELGASQIKGFDKDLMGCQAGESVTASFHFPKDYQDKELAGSEAVIQIKVHKVQEKKVPEIDAAFISLIRERVFPDIAGDSLADVAQLENLIKERLEAQESSRAENEAFNKAIDILISKNDFEVPPSRVSRFLDHMMEEASKYARSDESPPGREEIERRYRDFAVRSLKRHKIIDYIASKENITPTQEEVDAEIRKIAGQYKIEFDELKAELRKNGTTNRIRSDIRERKTLEFLVRTD